MHLQNTKGGTFIELLYIVAIIGILIALMMNYKAERRTLDISGHRYFQEPAGYSHGQQWATPIHDPECPKCKANQSNQ